jgi:hypothetical protein
VLVDTLALIVTLCQNAKNMTTNMTTFVIIKDIYDYYDYDAFGLVAKAIVIKSSTTIAITALVFFDYYIIIIIIIICNSKITIIRFIS